MYRIRWYWSRSAQVSVSYSLGYDMETVANPTWKQTVLLILGLLLVGCPQSGGPGGDDDDDDDNINLCEDAPLDLAGSMARAQGCPVGAEASLLIRGTPYDSILVEVDYTTSAPPRQDALDHLESVITDLLDKPAGVTIQVDDEIADPGGTLSLAQIQQIEDDHRDEFGLGTSAAVYFLYVGDPSDMDTQNSLILGLAHRATSLVMFRGNIDDVSGGIGQPSSEAVESTVIAHELGHVLGLVNIGTDMVNVHNDPDNQAHDVDEDCVMYFANNSSDLIANLLSGGVVPDFDTECRADIAAVRGN